MVLRSHRPSCVGSAGPCAAPFRRLHPLVLVTIATSALIALSAALVPAAEPSATPATQPTTNPAAAIPTVALPTNPDTKPIDDSLRKGVEFILSAFTNGELPRESDPVSETRRRALHALCVYSLLSAGQAISDPRLDPNGQPMGLMIDKLKAYDLAPNYALPFEQIVFARGLRAAALAMANRPEDRAVMAADVAWLVGAHCEGGYSFDDRYKNGAAPSPRNSAVTPGMDPISANRGGGGGTFAVDPKTKPPAPPKPDTTTSQVGKPPVSGVPGKVTNSGVPGGGGGGGGPVSVGHAPGSGLKWNAPMSFPTDTGAQITSHGLGWKPPVQPLPPSGNSGAKMTSKPVPGKVGSPKVSGGSPGVVPAGNTAGPKPSIVVSPQRSTTPIGVAPAGGETRIVVVPTLSTFPWNTFDSQFAVLGVAAGEDAGVNVLPNYWQAVQKFWQTVQLPEGTWPLSAGQPPKLAMTAGGLASLVTATDRARQANGLQRLAGDAPPAEIARALDWLEKRGNVTQIPTATSDYVGLDAFTILRAAQSLGLKYIGGHDWYREISAKLVSTQFPNGCWGKSSELTGDSLTDTAFCVAFLAQGRTVPMMNKLRYGEADWQKHSHDLANLAKFASTDLKRPLRWQVVDTTHEGTEWTDAPILYIAGSRAPRLSGQDIAKIKAFVDAGGVVLTHADSPGYSFTEWVKTTLAPAILKQPTDLKDLPADHAIYSAVHKLTKKQSLMGGNVGDRLVLVHCPRDIAASWDGPVDRDSREAFELGVNLYAYVTAARGK